MPAIKSNYNLKRVHKYFLSLLFCARPKGKQGRDSVSRNNGNVGKGLKSLGWREFNGKAGKIKFMGSIKNLYNESGKPDVFGGLRSGGTVFREKRGLSPRLRAKRAVFCFLAFRAAG